MGIGFRVVVAEIAEFLFDTYFVREGSVPGYPVRAAEQMGKV